MLRLTIEIITHLQENKYMKSPKPTPPPPSPSTEKKRKNKIKLHLFPKPPSHNE